MLFPPINTPEPTFIDGLGNIALLAAGITLLVFMFSYGTLANWRKWLAGRAIMFFVTGLVALLAHFIVSRFMGGDYLFRDVVRLAVYTYLFAVTLRLLVTFLVIWWKGNKEGETDPTASLSSWRRRKVEWTDLRREHRAERRALRERLRRRRWDSSDDRAAHEAAAAHQSAEDRSSSSPTSG